LLGNLLVLIAGNDSKIDHVDIEPGFHLAKLAGDGRIATGDVEAVPVGLYAKAALEKLGVWSSVLSKMAMTVNVRAALGYVARREALLGIVYATDAKIEPGVKVVGVFPDNSHDPIIYPVAATVNAKPGTIQYLAFLRSAAVTEPHDRGPGCRHAASLLSRMLTETPASAVLKRRCVRCAICSGASRFTLTK
jgi:molybdate transport system substrate-binding protein